MHELITAVAYMNIYKLLTNSLPVQKEGNQDFYSYKTVKVVNKSCRKTAVDYNDKQLDKLFSQDLTTLAGPPTFQQQ